MNHLKTIIFSVAFVLWLIPQISLAQQSRRFVAEWEPAWGTLIRWPLGIPSDLVVELATDDSLYVLVANQTQKTQAINTFSSWSVNLDHCQFIIAPTNSHWTRDWGPHYVFNENGVGGIADPYFSGYPWVPGCNPKSALDLEVDYERHIYGGYALDNAVNATLAENFNCPLISLPIFLTGGNVMVDGFKTAVATQQMLDENFPGFNEEQFRQMAADSLGISNFIIVDNPEVHGIQHIDCYAKFLDEETILVKKVPLFHPEFACCEALANHLGNETNAFGEPYEIVRVFCANYSGNNSAAYTNSFILNKKVLVPLFNIPEDEQALQVYEEAMPSYEVIGFSWGSWYYYDALHCRTMGIFDRYMLRIEHKPLKGDQIFAGLPVIKTRIHAYSDAGLINEGLKLYWREQGNFGWQQQPLVPVEGTDSLMAIIPGAEVSKIYNYFISASDSSGRNETHPITAPFAYHTFTYADNTTGIHKTELAAELIISPNPFTEITQIIFYNSDSSGRLTIWTADGKKVREWNNLPPGENKINWDGKDNKSNDIKSGTFIVVYSNDKFSVSTKCLLTD
ncbi:MAG: agmatine deiminase family protein [Bacteroidales bacterium]|nr:agmatine deiminase family protein [Bacteroidales bacterium]